MSWLWILWVSGRGATHIIENLTWPTRTDISGGKVRNHLYHLRQFKRVSGGPEDLFPSGAVESILRRMRGITKQYWNGNCSAPDHRALQRLVCLAELTGGSILPTVLRLFTGGHRARAGRIINHPGNLLFSFYTHNPFCTSTVSPSERAKETVTRPSGWHILTHSQHSTFFAQDFFFGIFYNKDWTDIFIGIKVSLLYIQEEITIKKTLTYPPMMFDFYTCALWKPVKAPCPGAEWVAACFESR